VVLPQHFEYIAAVRLLYDCAAHVFGALPVKYMFSMTKEDFSVIRQYGIGKTSCHQAIRHW
jgi:hypothetical protein